MYETIILPTGGGCGDPSTDWMPSAAPTRHQAVDVPYTAPVDASTISCDTWGEQWDFTFPHTPVSPDRIVSIRPVFRSHLTLGGVLLAYEFVWGNLAGGCNFPPAWTDYRFAGDGVDGVWVTQQGSAQPFKPGGALWQDIDTLLLQVGLRTRIGFNPAPPATFDGSQMAISIVNFVMEVAEQPTITVDGPADPVEFTTRPIVLHSFTGDPAFPTQTWKHVRIYTDAVVSAVGFTTANTTLYPPVWDSGELVSSTGDTQVGTDLANLTDYHAFVRAAASPNGFAMAPHWSDWESAEFSTDIALPAVPDFACFGEDEQGRIRLELEANAGDSDTQWFQVQRSTDGGTTWEDVRGATQLFDDTDYTWWDADSPAGVTTMYRARALANIGPDLTTVASAWTSTSSCSWDFTDEQADECLWWLKSPERPSLSILVRPLYGGLPSGARPRVTGVHEILGSTDVVPVQDVRRSMRGVVRLGTIDAGEYEALRTILAEGGRLLLQGPSDDLWGDDASAYIAVGNVPEARPPIQSLPWRELDLEYWTVPSPAGGIDPAYYWVP